MIRSQLRQGKEYLMDKRAVEIIEGDESLKKMLLVAKSLEDRAHSLLNEAQGIRDHLEEFCAKALKEGK